ncbi:DNA polymerase Y family protein [Sphingomonas lacunae]|uniref:DNA-directed DNA polymerase n=1 Tax=Sphingomonas lacunae TaxID=2698828 RepID=A0A6M4AT58_9SPHN|nr:DNA polymerase Y family protein [Sphingomonas lacunae]QJQ31259.1 DNA polymerase Y family protein [Sphingomonas lacunae]
MAANPARPPKGGTRAQRRFLALTFPFLSTDRLHSERRAAGREPWPVPIACVEKHRGAVILTAVDEAAAAQGLAPGLSLADARARVPDLETIEADPLADARWLEALADMADRYTPLVALDPLDGLTLDITGAAHLFGGERAMAADAEERIGAMGLSLRHAFAGTPEAAQALARFQTVPAPDEEAAIRRLPIAALRLEEEAVTGLRRAGLRTIGDLAGRPTAPLSARFGEEASEALARMLGRSDSRLSPRRVPPALAFARRFAEPLARTEEAVAVIGELVREAAQRLEARGKGGRRFAVRLFRSDGAVRDLAVETSLPVRDAEVVMRLFAERIDALADPIDPGFGFDLIRLAVPRLDDVAPTQLVLEGGSASNAGKDEAALVALGDRLATRHGEGRVRRLIEQDRHIPEQGVLALPLVSAPPPAPWQGEREEGEPPTRPIHLFDPPQPIQVMAEVPDGPPQRFRWQRRLHDVTRYEGPERIAAEWWNRDTPGLTRDYYRVEDARGRRLWVFRHGLYGDEVRDPGWYVHGVFV